MTAWTPTLVASEFLYTLLATDPDVLAALGGAATIYPRIAPNGVTSRHLDYDFVGPDGGYRAEGNGGGIVQIGLLYALTGWEPSYDDFKLQPLMEAVMTALVRADMRGKQVPFAPAAGGRRFLVSTFYQGPGVVPIDVTTGDPWMPARALYRLDLAPQ